MFSLCPESVKTSNVKNRRSMNWKDSLPMKYDYDYKTQVQ